MTIGYPTQCFTPTELPQVNYSTVIVILYMIVQFQIDFEEPFGFGCSCFDAKWLVYRYICKTRENSNFLKKGKMVILVKIRKFSRSRMMKRTSPLESSREI